MAAPGGCQLTDEGQALLDALTPLHDWANRWSERSQSRYQTS